MVTITANGNYTVTGTTTANRIVINKDVTATVTLNNANIHSAVASPFALSSDTIAGGKGSQVTLILSGTNELVTTGEWSESPAGLTVEDSARITVEGNGSLLAQGAGKEDGEGNGNGGAGIGSGTGKAAGTVIIQSGTVTATGGHLAAGIGGGYIGDGGNVTVTGGTITATGGDGGAGIGGGTYGEGGNITVTGGTITATGVYMGAGIGGSCYGRNGGDIIITGGTITATGGIDAAGIGGGWGGEGGNITVTGGTVTATGGSCGAGIGGGRNGNGGNITITRGTVTATGKYGAGIGGGYQGEGGNITIRGGVVVSVAVISTGDPAGIGGGGYGDAGTVNITGGTFYASGGIGPGIGGGARATGGVINITGGTVIADEIGIGNGSTTATNISGANTVVLSPSINATTYGGATVLTGTNVNVSDTITTGDTIADVTLNAALTIPSGATLVVPAGIVFDVNHKALTNNGLIRQYGSIINKGSLTGSQPVGAIQVQALPAQTYTYTGDSIKPPVTVTDGTLTLAHGVHYTVAYSNNVNAGLATATVTDLGDYSIVGKTFTIAPKALAADFIQDISPLPYTGDSIKPAIVVTDGSKTLTLNTDYTVGYTNNLNAGTATVTVTGIGNYTGTVTKTFTIIAPQKQIAAEWLDSISLRYYTGDSIEPYVIVRDGSKILTFETDYIVTYRNNVYPGTATVTVTGIGNYTGIVTKTFIITKSFSAVSIEDIPAQTYTGDSIKPAIMARDGNIELTAGRDYTVRYESNTGVGTALATITGAGDYSGAQSKIFAINPRPIATNWLEDPPVQTYTGSAVTPPLTVRDDRGVVLTSGFHYTASWLNNVNAGMATVVITGRGNYTGSAGKPFFINPKPVSAQWIADIPAQTYTGVAIEPALTVKDGYNILTPGVHYSATYNNNVNAGTATVTITGMGNYTGTASKTFTIVTAPVPITAGWIEDIPAQSYTGDSIMPAVVVRDGGTTLTLKTDYTVTYINNVNAGTATVTVTGMGDYTGSASKTFIIVKPLAGVWLEDIPAQTYTGSSIQPAITVWDGNSLLAAGVHYSVTWMNNVNAGTATVTVVGLGNYSGTASKSFTIHPKAVAADWLEDIPAQTYTGSYIEPGVVVRDGSKTLTSGADYTVAYMNNTYIGTATVTITGMGNYVGSASKNFAIIAGPNYITAEWLEYIPPQIYTGSSIQPEIVVKAGDKVLTRGVDYTTGYSNNINAGTATVGVIGMGDYTGVANKTFTILPKAVAGEWLEDIPTQYYTGSPVELSLTIRDGARILTQGIDYVLDYTNNVYVGTARVTLTGKGNYTGTATGTFKIIRNGIPIQESWVQVIPDQYYTGSSVRPKVIVTGLVEGVDYTSVYFNNVEAGTAWVTVVGIGSYAGEVTLYFRIIATGTEEAASAALRIAPAAAGGILVSGLTPGKTLSIYTLQGQLIYQATATSPEEHIHLQDKGIYILRHKGRGYKFNW
ncbi:MAG: Ig-like domain-containing protein [Bacteroidales bacterium]